MTKISKAENYRQYVRGSLGFIMRSLLASLWIEAQLTAASLVFIAPTLLGLEAIEQKYDQRCFIA